MATQRMGLTIVEVLVALVLIAVAVAVLATTTISSFRQDANAAGRTQAVQLLNYLGRLASSSDVALLSSAQTWDYGELRSAFQEISAEAGRANPDLYRATIEEVGSAGIGSSSANLYEVTVCWRIGDQENCVEGTTAGLPIPIGTDPAPDPVVN